MESSFNLHFEFPWHGVFSPSIYRRSYSAFALRGLDQRTVPQQLALHNNSIFCFCFFFSSFYFMRTQPHDKQPSRPSDHHFVAGVSKNINKQISRYWPTNGIRKVATNSKENVMSLFILVNWFQCVFQLECTGKRDGNIMQHISNGSNVMFRKKYRCLLQLSVWKIDTICIKNKWKKKHFLWLDHVCDEVHEKNEKNADRNELP